MSKSYRYCPYCARALQPFSSGGRLRLRCPTCEWIRYQNPTVGVAVVLLEAKCVLLGERRDGGWCIPCGHVEWDETIEKAAVREFREETGVKVRLDGVVAVHSNFHDPDHHTVGVWYRGIRQSGDLRAGGDLDQVGFFPLSDVPELKFPTDRLVVVQLQATGPE